MRFILKGKSVQAIDSARCLRDVTGQQALIVAETAICGWNI
jgi:hypothetical protein